MPSVVFILADGVSQRVDTLSGMTVMETARAAGIAGILAQCRGASACATCHVYVESAWLDRIAPPEDIEQGMLETAWEPRPNSRLSCQIEMNDALDGLTVHVPARQSTGI